MTGKKQLEKKVENLEEENGVNEDVRIVIDYSGLVDGIYKHIIDMGSGESKTVKDFDSWRDFDE
ncbi:MAG: hypothetical protein ACLFUR_05325 [Candidatus Hadarchaeia archaeon]